jgi:hypothetical protein
LATFATAGKNSAAGRLRPYGQSQAVDHEYSEPDETGEILEGLFVAGGDSAELFDSGEEAFDLVAVFVARVDIGAITTNFRQRAQVGMEGE